LAAWVTRAIAPVPISTLKSATKVYPATPLAICHKSTILDNKEPNVEIHVGLFSLILYYLPRGF
jgi:hypothetical protein